MTSFWKGIKKNYNSRVLLAPMINNCIGENDICDMWQAYYKDLLNSVESSESKKFVERKLTSIADSLIVFTPANIFKALKNTKNGKACEVDGLAAEHFIYANPIICIFIFVI